METSDAIHAWRSIRRWKPDPVPDDVIKKLLEAARRAPSWENVQPWRFIVITDPAVKEKLMELSFGQKTLRKAPVIIACAGDISAWSRESQRASLVELRDAGAVQATDEIIDKVFLSNRAFAPNLGGDTAILARTFEQLTYAIGFMLIEAVNQGLGVCIVGAFGNEVTGEKINEYQNIKSLLNLPEICYLLTLLCIGYPDESPPARPRISLAEIAFREQFGSPFE